MAALLSFRWGAELVRTVLAALPWRPVAMGSIAALCLLSGAAVWPESGFTAFGVKLAMVCLAAAAAFVLDEPAAAAVDSAPRTLRARTAIRLVALACPAAVGAGGVLAINARLHSTPSGALAYGGLLLQMAGCLLLGVTGAAIARRFNPEPGELVSGAAAGLLTALVIYNPFARWVEIFALSPEDRWSRTVILWTVVCLLCIAGLARSTRDPLA